MSKNHFINFLAHGISLVLILYLFLVDSGDKVPGHSAAEQSSELRLGDIPKSSEDSHLMDERIDKITDLQDSNSTRIEWLEQETHYIREELSKIAQGDSIGAVGSSRESVLGKYGPENFEREASAKIAKMPDAFEDNYGVYPNPELHQFVGTVLKDNISPAATSNYECRSDVCKIVLTGGNGLDVVQAAEGFTRAFPGQMTITNKPDGSVVIFARN